jgi:ABC-2 type transport system ATP-binding protein
MSGARAVLDVSGLCKSYGRTVALDSVDLSVCAGQIVGLLGPNGAGKTTLVSIVAGLSRLDSGSVRVNGVDVDTESRRARQAIGFAPQELGICPKVSVYNNLEFFGKLAGLRQADLRRQLDEVTHALGLTPLLDRLAGQLSGGQQRRLHTAIAMLNRPQLLLLDEPTTGVDLDTRADLLRLVRSMADHGCAVCYLTHYLTEVEELGASVAILEKGRILVHGTLDELIEAHGDSSVVELGFVPGSSPIDVPGAIFGEDGRLRVSTPDAPSLLGQVLVGLGPRVHELQSVEVVRPSLESVYLRVTGRRYKEAQQ